jgi:hypothetical protein
MHLTSILKKTFAVALMSVGAVSPFVAAQAVEILDRVVAPAAAPQIAPAVAPKDTKPGKEGKQPDEAADAVKPAAPAAGDAKEKAKQKSVVTRRAVVRNRPTPEEVQNAAERRLWQQYEPILKTELSFAARAAGLDDDERRQLITESKKWFDTFLADFVTNRGPNQQQMIVQNGQVIRLGRGRGARATDPRESIRKGLANVVAASVPSDKAKAYAEECRLRNDFERQVSIDNMVAQIDDKVFLSSEQRKKITAALTAHWSEVNKPQIEAFAIGGPMRPFVPNEWVLPELTPAQRAVMDKLKPVSGQVFLGGGVFGVQGGVIEDIDLGIAVPAGGAIIEGPVGPVDVVIPNVR